jgi:uncharacterized protein (TIGR03790 family)
MHLALICALVALQDPAQALLIRNANVPEGAEVAEAWRAWREADGAAEIVIHAPADERVPRAVYERDIAGPVKIYLESAEGAGIRWLIPVYGVPLGIIEQPSLDGSSNPDQQRDEAAVDSELALLRASQTRTDGWIESPLFERATPLGAGDSLLGVIRLDGPTARIAASLPEKAVLAETFGAGGRSFLDTRGLTDTADGYGYRDVHMRTVRAAWDALGLAYDHDDAMEVVDPSARENFLHYYGWYAGDPSAWTGMPRFRTGAIAVHLHSSAAHTLRNARANWCAPLLAAGATATYGTVFEPYTIGFPYEGVLWDRVARGWSFGEAAVAAAQLVSWQAVFIGDPFYRPYAEGSAAAQIERRALMSVALAAWPQVPVVEPFPRFLPAWRGLGSRLDAISEHAGAGDEMSALAALDELLFLCRDWDFDAAFAKALAPALAADLRRELGELDKILVREPADPEALARFTRFGRAAAMFGLGERHAELGDKLRGRQEAVVEKALDAKRPGLKSGRLLRHWRALRRAERCTLSERAPEAALTRMALERDPEFGPALTGEAEESLIEALRTVDPLLRKENYREAEELLRSLDAEHPECPAKAGLREMLTRAAEHRAT